MAETTHLGLAYLAASQAQKHVTVNEALRKLDSLVQLSVKSRSLAVPPGAALEGDRYIPASGAVGAWAGADWNLVVMEDGAWVKYVPVAGWMAWVEDEQRVYVRMASGWQVATAAPEIAADTVVARSPNGAEMRFVVREELVANLSGAFRNTGITIPNGAIVFNVSERVVTTVTGASSFGVGTAAEPTKFGNLLGVQAGSSNRGTIGPTGFYADTPVRLTANGGNFSGGAIRVAIHFYLPVPPQG